MKRYLPPIFALSLLYFGLAFIAVSVSGDDFGHNYMITLQNRATKKYFGYDTDFNAEARDTPFFFKVTKSGSYYSFSPWFHTYTDGTLASSDKKIKLRASGSNYRSALETGTGFKTQWTRIAQGTDWQLRNRNWNQQCLRSIYIGDGPGFGPGMKCTLDSGTIPYSNRWIIRTIAYGASTYNPISGAFWGPVLTSNPMITLQNRDSKKYIGYTKGPSNRILKATDYPFFFKFSFPSGQLRPYFETKSDGVLLALGDEYLKMETQVGPLVEDQKYSFNIDPLDGFGLNAQWNIGCNPDTKLCTFRNAGTDSCLQTNNGGSWTTGTHYCGDGQQQFWRVTTIPIETDSVVAGDAVPMPLPMPMAPIDDGTDMDREIDAETNNDDGIGNDNPNGAEVKDSGDGKGDGWFDEEAERRDLDRHTDKWYWPMSFATALQLFVVMVCALIFVKLLTIAFRKFCEIVFCTKRRTFDDKTLKYDAVALTTDTDHSDSSNI